MNLLLVIISDDDKILVRLLRRGVLLLFNADLQFSLGGQYNREDEESHRLTFL